MITSKYIRIEPIFTRNSIDPIPDSSKNLFKAESLNIGSESFEVLF